jgi:predicted acetyltransferase
MAELFDVFTLWDDWYVEKQLEETRVCAGDPPFEIVPYIMTRITHVENMLSLLRSKKPVKVVLEVRDEIILENNGQFLWEISEHESTFRKVTGEEPEICLTIAELTELVFGKREVKGLEDIKVLSKICINEAV